MSAWMSYRAAEQLISGLLPIKGGRHHTTLRNRIFRHGVASDIPLDLGSRNPQAERINLGLDCTFIRSHDPAIGRQHEVFFGHVEPDGGNSRVFSSIGEGSAERIGRIQQNLARAGFVASTSVTTFTDGGSGLRELAQGSGLRGKPILDWYHVAQRLQHIRQSAVGLKTSVPDLPEVTEQIIAEVERLRWRLWNGKPNAVEKTIEKIRQLVKTKRKPSKTPLPRQPWNGLMTGLFFLQKYTAGQEA